MILEYKQSILIEDKKTMKTKARSLSFLLLYMVIPPRSHLCNTSYPPCEPLFQAPHGDARACTFIFLYGNRDVCALSSHTLATTSGSFGLSCLLAFHKPVPITGHLGCLPRLPRTGLNPCTHLCSHP